jgi:glycosidase
MNYHGFAFLVKGFLLDGRMPGDAFAAELNRRRADYSPSVQQSLQNLIDSHDTDRMASMIVNTPDSYLQPERFDYDIRERVSPRYWPEYDVRRPNERERQIQRLAALFQMTYVGAPMIYYGTEAGMWGADDPDVRKPMVWPDLTYAPETAHPRGGHRPVDPVEFDRELFEFYRSVIALRRAHEALRRGEFVTLHAGKARATFAFLRLLSKHNPLLVILNRDDRALEIELNFPRGIGADPDRWKLLLASAADASVRANRAPAATAHFSLAPLAGAVYEYVQ